MSMIPAVRTLAAVLFAGITTTTIHFSSTLYPYSIDQPSSFRHIIFTDTDNHRVDYFFPALGSFTTNANIYAVPGRDAPDEQTYLHSIGGHHVKRSARISIAGQLRPVMRGDFKGIAGRWTIEQVTFAAHGYVWHLTASYDVKYKKMRPILIAILSSFKLH